jgi:hypothetical protein
MIKKGRLAKEVLFDEERLVEWFKKGRFARKAAGLQKHCRHGFHIVELTNIGNLQICCRCFRTLFV